MRPTAPMECLSAKADCGNVRRTTGGATLGKRGGRVKIRKKKGPPDLPGASWMEQDGLHLTIPGTAPGEAEMAELTRRYQENIRRSPLWNEMVQRFGKDKAELLLREFRVEKR